MSEIWMRAVQGQRLELSAYQLQNLPVPQPQAGEIRVRVHSAGVGFVDGLLCSGGYQVKPPVPFVPGCEFAGIIDEVGAQVTAFNPGDRVAALGLGGGFADYAVVPATALTRLPDALDFSRAAVCWVDYTTALHALRDRAKLQDGESVLVLGAAGGLGQAMIQVANWLGGRVIAAASTPAKREAALAAGAWQSVDYTQADWVDQLKVLTDGEGLQVIVDPIGGPGLEKAFRRLAWGGRYLVLGFAAGSIPALPVNLTLLKGATLMGVDVRQYGLFEPRHAAQSRQLLADLIAAGELNPLVGRRYPLEDFAQALSTSLDRDRIGKTVVEVQPS